MEENANFLATKGMIWKNTIPRAPWGGGVYERLIGLTKRALRRAIGRKLLKEGELITLIVEIEGILNTRPLTYVGFDDYRIIRPIDFISPMASLDLPINYDSHQDEYTPYTIKTKDTLVKYWTSTLTTLDVFWKLWKEEYLTSLRERTQRELKSPRIVEKRVPHENEIVLLNEPEIPRGVWKLARIIKINRGWDGKIRSATIQLPNGKQIDRSINMLYPMEIDATEDKEEKVEDEPEEPIARRTRSAKKSQTTVYAKDKSNLLIKTLSLITMMALIPRQVLANNSCNWITGVPFNIPEKWNCEEIIHKNATYHKVDVYTRTHVRIPAIKCNNITRTVCKKAFLRISLSVVSDHTSTTATSSQFCRYLNVRKQMNGIGLIQSSPNQWITNKEIQYSYGWLGVNCQSTSNFILTQGEILLYDGRGAI
uniref:DUF5641 domain-containing protein n=1 Tax=Wuchereria bancrofti TaxID=6293 RepID=A0AAF5PKS8_WUCBA